MSRTLQTKVLNCEVGIIIFFISYAAIFAYSFMGHIPVLGGYLKLIENCALVLLALAFLLRIKFYTGQELVVLIGLMAISIAVICSSGDFSLIKLSLLLAVVKGINLKDCARFDMVMRFLLLIVMVPLSISGLIPDATSFSSAGELRHSLGFTNPNQLGMICTILCIEILYLNNMKIKLKTFLVVVTIMLFSEVFSGSRTAELISGLALVLCVLNTYYPKAFTGSFFLRGVQICPLLFAGITAIGVILYQNGSPQAEALNQLLSNRLDNIAYHLELTDIRMFGSNIANNQRTLDSCYAYVLLGQGIVVAAGYLMSIPALMRRARQQHDYALMIVFLCFLIYGLSERLWLNVDYNILMLGFSSLIFPINKSVSPRVLSERTVRGSGGLVSPSPGDNQLHS